MWTFLTLIALGLAGLFVFGAWRVNRTYDDAAASTLGSLAIAIAFGFLAWSVWFGDGPLPTGLSEPDTLQGGQQWASQEGPLFCTWASANVDAWTYERVVRMVSDEQGKSVVFAEGALSVCNLEVRESDSDPLSTTTTTLSICSGASPQECADFMDSYNEYREDELMEDMQDD